MPSRMIGMLVLAGGLILAVTGIANATPSVSTHAVPELDAGAIGSGLALLTGGVLLMAERRRRRKQ
jgi:hypothetical protein